jgi:hypothetical protein
MRQGLNGLTARNVTFDAEKCQENTEKSGGKSTIAIAPNPEVNDSAYSNGAKPAKNRL